MLTAIIVIHLMLVLALIGMVLLQKSEGGGLISSTSGFLSSRGTAKGIGRKYPRMDNLRSESLELPFQSKQRGRVGFETFSYQRDRDPRPPQPLTSRTVAGEQHDMHVKLVTREMFGQKRKLFFRAT